MLGPGDALLVTNDRITAEDAGTLSHQQKDLLQQPFMRFVHSNLFAYLLALQKTSRQASKQQTGAERFGNQEKLARVVNESVF